MPDYDPLTISDEALKQLPPAERGAVYKARAAARAAGGGGAAPAPGAAAVTPPVTPGVTPATTGPAAAAAASPSATPAGGVTPPVTPVPTGPAAAAAVSPGAEASAGGVTPAVTPAAATSVTPAGSSVTPGAGTVTPGAGTVTPGAGTVTPGAGAVTPAARPAPPAAAAAKPVPEKPKEPPFVQRVLEAVPDATWQWRHGYAEMKVPRDQLLTAARTLRAAGFDYLSFVSEVDWQDRLELVYHLFAYDFRAQPMGAILRCDLPRDGMPEVASVTPVWPGAEFMEREAFEMMGIRFLGHPDLRRILLPDDFVGFPMRRDYETDFDYITVKQLVHESD